MGHYEQSFCQPHSQEDAQTGRLQNMENGFQEVLGSCQVT